MKQSKRLSGFTLIELLVVIGIIVILSVVVVLTLNPAELLKQARDSNRVSDMATLKSSLALFLADQTVPNLASSTAGYNTCYAHHTSTVSGSLCTASLGGNVRFSTALYVFSASSSVNSFNVDGRGWLPVSFSLISSGAPISALPVDPTNNGTYFYGYIATSSPSYAYKLAAKMESTKYRASGSSDVETTDGGAQGTTYEVGTLLSM